ncbi:MAG: L,D-transpeptidase [Moraxella sp.]|nr:L,D-transpeptidase [Moraxella sp.]
MSQVHIIVDTAAQTLTLYDQNNHLIKSYLVSTAKNGTGQLENSGCTPLGEHVICTKIGDGLPINSVFLGRVFTGEICTPELVEKNPDRDWILSRILWLDGCEAGFNQGLTADGKMCDTKARYIYIHGTPDSEPMGVPRSHGCVRMRNDEMMELFERVSVGTPVRII